MIKTIKHLAIILFLFPAFVFSQGLLVDYPGGSGPMFYLSNIAPGDNQTKLVKVTNNGSSTQNIGFQIISSSGNGLLADAINLTIIDVNLGDVLYSGNLTEAKSGGELKLGQIDPETYREFNFIAEFDKTAGNEYQNQLEVFNLTIGFIGEGTILGDSDERQPSGKIQGAIDFLAKTGADNIFFIMIGTFFILTLSTILRKYKNKIS